MSSDALSTLTLTSTEDLRGPLRGGSISAWDVEDALPTVTLTSTKDLRGPRRGDSISTWDVERRALHRNSNLDQGSERTSPRGQH